MATEIVFVEDSSGAAPEMMPTMLEVLLEALRHYYTRRLSGVPSVWGQKGLLVWNHREIELQGFDPKGTPYLKVTTRGSGREQIGTWGRPPDAFDREVVPSGVRENSRRFFSTGSGGFAQGVLP
jgi:hypothetical protein